MKGNKSSTFSRAALEKARGLEPCEPEEGTEDKLEEGSRRHPYKTLQEKHDFALSTMERHARTFNKKITLSNL